MAARALGASVRIPGPDTMRVEGLEVTARLLWAGGSWRPGGEFVQRLVVKNATTRTIHVVYTLPREKKFFMAFPAVLSLSPGMSVPLEVRFRPIRFEELEDTVDFVVEGSATFSVPIAARLAELAVQVSPEAAFGYSPVNEPTSQTILVRNVGTVDAGFAWEVAPPFLLTPRSGRVNVGETATITVTVVPMDASVLRSEAFCSVQGGEQLHLVRLTAQGKYQHVIVTPKVIDYGEVLVRSGRDVTERTVTVRNEGFVRSTVDVENVDMDRRQLFSVRPATAMLEPGEEAEFTVRFLADASGMYSCEHLRFTTPGGSATIVTCKARTVGPRVTIARKDRGVSGAAAAAVAAGEGLDTGAGAGTGGTGATTAAPRPRRPLSVQFGDVRVGEEHSSVVTLTNHSRAPALFDLECEDSGVFFFNETKGTVPALLYKSLVVVFRPPVAGNFWRRVPCLVLDSSPVYVDLIGTAYDDKHRPNPLRQRHVDAFRLRPIPLRLLAPDLALEIIERGELATDDSRALEAEWAVTEQPTRSGDRMRSANALYSDYFIEPDDASRTVCLLADRIEFGAATRARPPPQQLVHVANRTNGKMTIQWVVPPSNTEAGRTGGLLDFAVAPESSDVDPGSTAEFRVAFRPSQDSFYYFQELEAYVAPKTNRSFRLVDDKSFTPPQCLSLKVTGHTFRDAQSFQPKVQTSFGGGAHAQTLHVPPCVLGDAVFHTFQVFNSSEVPAAFDFDADPNGIFCFEPSTGMLPVHGYQLITVRFMPRHARRYRTTLSLVLNHSPSVGTMRLTIVGQGGLPRMMLPDGGIFCIKPTCLGVSSSRICTLRNVSRLPLRFEWRVPRKHAGEVLVAPGFGDIEGNATLDVLVTFAPRATGKVKVHIPVDVFFVTGSETNSLLLVEAAEAGRSVTKIEMALHGRRGSSDDGAGKESEEKKQEGDGDEVEEGGDQLPLPAKYRGAAQAERVPGSPLQRLTLTLLTEGTSGALTFLSPTLDFGASLVQGTSHMPVYIENKSDCTLHFKLDAVVQIQQSNVDLDRDDEGIVEMDDIDPEFEAARWLATNRRLRANELAAAQEFEGGLSGPAINNRSPGGAGGSEGSCESRPNLAAAEEGRKGTHNGQAVGGREHLTRLMPGMPGVALIEGEASVNLPPGVRKGVHGTFTRTISLHADDPRIFFKSQVTGERGAVVPILRFDPPTGVIPAHSKVRADVSFSPASAGTYRFRIYYETRTEADGSGSSASISLPASAMSKAAALHAAADAEADTRDPATVDWGSEATNSNALFCDAVGIGAYPTVCVEDVRQLTSREAFVVLFPRHFAGMHNHFAPESTDHAISALQAALLAVQQEVLLGATNARAGSGGGSGGLSRSPAATTAAAAAAPSANALVPASTASSVPPPPPPPQAPRDAWVRAEAFVRDAVAWGSAFPQDRGWGGWKFSLPSESRDPLVGYASREIVAPHQASVLDLLSGVAESTVPGSRGALWRLWTQFSLRDLNRFLSTRLSRLEDRYNRATQMTRDPTTLASFPFEFAPAPLGSPPMVVLMHFSNNGKLASFIDFQFPNERDMDVEPWAEVDEPTRDELNDNELLERRIFDVQPRSLRLLPGQSASVRLHYAYSTMISGGRHEVIVMLRLKNGKPVRLMLRGCTLAPNLPYLYCGIPSRVLRLAAVPLGLAQPPVQSVLVANPSAVAIRYEVLAGSLRALAAASYGVEIVSVQNPTGTLPPGGEVHLRVVFRPIEARMYRVRLDVAYVALVDGGRGDEQALAAVRERVARGGEGPSEGDDDEEEDEAAAAVASSDGVRVGAAVPVFAQTGVGVASGTRGYEADIAGLLQVRIAAQGYLQQGESRMPLIAVAPTVGLGLVPPVPPVSNSPQLHDLEATLGAATYGSLAAAAGPAARPTNEGALRRAQFGLTAACDSIADGIYSISGVDALAASISTFYNPYDVVSLSGGWGQGGGGGFMQLFSGPDASASAVATSKLQRAQGLLSLLALHEHTISGNAPANSVAYAHDVDHAASENAATLDDDLGLQRSAMFEGSTANVLAPQQVRRGVALPPTPSSRSRAAAVNSLYRLVARLNSPVALRALYRPAALPPLFFSAFPPLRRWATVPHHDMPEGAAILSNEWAQFGDVPVGGITHRIVTLRNRRVASADAQGRLAGDGPVLFLWDARHPLVASGALRIQPMTGTIEAGQAQLVRLTFAAPDEPQVFVADVACVITLSVSEQRRRAVDIVHNAIADLHQYRATMVGAGGSRAKLAQGIAAVLGAGASHPGGSAQHKISVADKTTANRSNKLEQLARESAHRLTEKTAVAYRRRSRSNYHVGAVGSALSGRGTTGGASSGAGELDEGGTARSLSRGDASRGDSARGDASRGDSPRGDTARGEALRGDAELEGAASRGAFLRVAEEPRPFDDVDATSVQVTVGADRPLLADAHARAHPLGNAAHAPVRGRAMEGTPGGHGQLATLLMRTAVKEREPQNLQELALSGTLHSRPGGGEHAETMRLTQPRPALEVDVDTQRRSRISSRAHSRLSQPRAHSVGTAPPTALADVLDGTAGDSVGVEALTEAAANPRNVDTAAMPLPQPPHAPLFLHVTVRACGIDEFVQAYSPQHLAAFYHPLASARPKFVMSGVGGASGSSSTHPHAHRASAASAPPSARGARASTANADDPAVQLARAAGGLPAIADAVRGVLTSLLSDVVADADLTRVLTVVAGGDTAVAAAAAAAASSSGMQRHAGLVPSHDAGAPPAEEPSAAAARRLAEAAELVGGLTFAEVAEARGDIASLATRVAARLAERGAESDLAATAQRAASGSIFDVSVPPLLPGARGLDIGDHPDAVRALVHAECRDFCARLLEGALLGLVSEAQVGAVDLFNAGTAAPVGPDSAAAQASSSADAGAAEATRGSAGAGRGQWSGSDGSGSVFDEDEEIEGLEPYERLRQRGAAPAYSADGEE